MNKYGNANAWRYCCKVFDLLTIAAVSEMNVFVDGMLCKGAVRLDHLSS